MVNEFTSLQTAQYLGITKQRVGQLRTEGHLQARRFGRQWMYAIDSVEALRTAREHMPPQPGRRSSDNPSRGALASRRARERRAAVIAAIKAAAEPGG